MDRHPSSSSLCRIGISQSQTNDVVLGLIFLRNFYVIFDMDQDRVGIAKHQAMNSTIEVGLNYHIDVKGRDLNTTDQGSN